MSKQLIIDDQNIYELSNSNLIKLVARYHQKVEEGNRKNVITQIAYDKTNEHFQCAKNEIESLKVEIDLMRANRIKNEAQIEELQYCFDQERGRIKQENHHNIDVMNFENKKAQKLWFSGHEQIKDEFTRINRKLQTEINEKTEQHRRLLKNKTLEYANSLNHHIREIKKSCLTRSEQSEKRVMTEMTKEREHHEEEKQNLETMYNVHAKNITDDFTEKLNESIKQNSDQILIYSEKNDILKKKLERALLDDLILKQKIFDLKIINKKYLNTLKNNDRIITKCARIANLQKEWQIRSENISDNNYFLQKLLKQKEYKIASLENDIIKWKQAYKVNEERFNKEIADLHCKFI